ncbi:TonB-dependent siderophore receptor [Aliarcobacter lanthieri]|uniref:TonB-dependent siderophore receptor n=1 Tax=Aliarcobacter lanthieri TaxID=1355374 RepID=UPI003AAD0DF2
MEQLKAKFITSASAILLCSALLGQEAYTIKNMSLKQALEKISKESKLSFIVDESLIDGKKATNIENVQDLKEALTKVLEGSGLNATIENNTIIIKEIPSYKIINGTYILDDVSVKSALGSTTEGSNSYTTGSMRTATKLDLSIRETPQSVSVITQQMLEDKKIDDFDTLMKNVTGAISDKGIQDNRAYYYLRGFSLDYYQMDGIPMPISIYSANNYNMDKFDRVEVVKGANGLTSGAGEPSGAINMIRKHANSKVFTGSIDASAGSWDTYKIKTDISTPLNSDGSVRARLVASHKETDTFKDRVHNENDLVYAVVDADITDTTTISAGASYEKEDLDGDSSNLPAFYKDGTKTNFDRSKNFSSDWSYWNTERESYFLDVKQYLPNDILINAVYTHNDIKTDHNYGYIYVWGPGLNKDGSGLRYREFGNWLQNIKEDNVDIYSSIPLKIFNREHEIIAGFQYNKQKTDYSRKTLSKYTDIDNLHTQNGSEIPLSGTTNPKPKFEDTDTQQTAFYLTGKFEIVDDLKLILGGRLTNWEYERYAYIGNTTTKYDVKNEFTPFVGLVYDIDENHSAYASYTDIFKPQNFKDENDNLLDPVVGKNYEVGVKGEYFDKRLNAGITLFRIEQDNVAEDTGDINPITGTSIYKAKDGVTSKGVELEISGKLTDNWDLSAGFTHFEAKEANGEKFNTRAPRNNINIFTKYSMNDFSVGAGVNWKSKGFMKSGALEVSQDAYTTVDLMASYNFTKSLTGQLNINNLFDKKYYSGYSGREYVYGEPVNALVSLKYKF